VSLINSPHKWETGKEYAFPDGTFGRRFVGTITAAVNAMAITVLNANIGNVYIMNVGGWWNPGNAFPIWRDTIGHVFDNSGSHYSSFLTLKDSGSSGLHLVTKSASARTGNSYDIWVRYTKSTTTLEGVV